MKLTDNLYISNSLQDEYTAFGTNTILMGVDIEEVMLMRGFKGGTFLFMDNSIQNFFVTDAVPRNFVMNVIEYYQFYQISDDLIVNMNYVTKVTDKFIFMKDRAIPVAYTSIAKDVKGFEAMVEETKREHDIFGEQTDDLRL